MIRTFVLFYLCILPLSTLYATQKETWSSSPHKKHLIRTLSRPSAYRTQETLSHNLRAEIHTTDQTNSTERRLSETGQRTQTDYFHSETQQTSGAERLLIKAVLTGNVEKVRQLLALGINVHANAEEPLRVASAQRHARVVELLVSAGADTTIDNYGELIKAHLRNDFQTLLVLMGMPLERAGAPAIFSEKARYTYSEIFGKIFDPRETILELALLCACVDNNIPVAQDMLAKGANVHARNDLPLRLAVKHNYQDLAALLQAHINSGNCR
jgi:ankyrin repeat protein